MTDDLFDDFDLDDPKDKKITDDTANKADTSENDDIAESSYLSSEKLHPDIFTVENMQNDGEMTDDEIRHLAAVIDEENPPLNKTFSFSDAPHEKDDMTAVNIADDIPEIPPEIRTIDKIRRPNVAIDPENFGDTLRKLRESACVSLADLADELKIKESFLSALEREDYNNLPPEVFIVAYIRKLGGVYHLTEDEIVALSGKVRARMEIELPEDMDKVVAVYEPSEENENKLRHIITLFSIIAATAVLLIAVGVYFFVSANIKNKTTDSPRRKNSTKQFSAETLLQLQPQVKLEAQPLKITK